MSLLKYVIRVSERSQRRGNLKDEVYKHYSYVDIQIIPHFWLALYLIRLICPPTALIIVNTK